MNKITSSVKFDSILDKNAVGGLNKVDPDQLIYMWAFLSLNKTVDNATKKLIPAHKRLLLMLFHDYFCYWKCSVIRLRVETALKCRNYLK